MHTNKQKGSAILSAIFVAAIVAIISVAIYRLSNQPLQSALSKGQQIQAQFLLDSALVDAENQLQATSSLLQPLSFSAQVTGHSVQVEVDSPQALFNVNTLSKMNRDEIYKYTTNLTAFLKSIAVSQPDATAEALIAAVNHQLLSGGDGGELYEWPGNPFVIPSSLRAIAGLSLTDYQRIKQWLTALPPGTAYIPQPGKSAVLLAYGLSKPDSTRVADCLKKNRISLSATLTQCQLADKSSSQALAKLIADPITHYFTIHTVLVLNNTRVQKTTLLYRQKIGNTTRWYVVWQHTNWNE